MRGRRRTVMVAGIFGAILGFLLLLLILQIISSLP